MYVVKMLFYKNVIDTLRSKKTIIHIVIISEYLKIQYNDKLYFI